LPRIIFVFLDGVGLGRADESNPFWLAQTEAIHRLLGGPLVAGAEQSRPGLSLLALDTRLGVDGLPQSATGQVSLFTGVNAAQLLGYHLPAFPNGPLKDVIRERSILRRATELGYRATFANAYTPMYFETVSRTNRPMSATTHAVLGANLPFRWLSDLEKGRAVYWDITNEHLVEQYHLDMPIITAEEAGRNLARLADDYDLVLYESFLTDVVGHKKDAAQAVAVVERLDRFLGSLWASVAPDVTVVVSSDHGNIEDLTQSIHTLNPAPLLVVGPGASAFRQARALTDVAERILRVVRGVNDEDNELTLFDERDILTGKE